MKQPARPMVLSLDDGPSLADTPGLTPAERHAAILDALCRHHATAVLYVTLGFGADRPEGQAMLCDWVARGHLLGNHTVTHPDLHDDQLPLQRYLDEINACDDALRGLPGWRRWFRPTYLHAGHTDERRLGLQAHLDARGYRLAGVDIDSRDWAFEAPLHACLHACLREGLTERPQDASSDASALKGEFLDQLRDRVRACLAAPQPPQPAVLLLHHGLLAALWLDEVLGLLREEGFAFVHPDRAFVE